MSQRTSRRHFLKISAAAGAAVWASGPSLASAQSPKTVSANEKIGLAFIGVGGKGSDTLNIFNRDPDLRESINVVALCDADESMIANIPSKYPNARRHTDYRRMLETQKD